jgi:hypothetical protein
MPTLRHAVLFLLLFGGVRAVHAQDTTRAWALGADNQSDIYLGLAFSPRFRLETELGLVRNRAEVAFTFLDNFGNLTTVTDEITTAYYRVGTGLLWQWQRVPRVRLYGGPRFGLIAVRSKERITGGATGQVTERRTDWFLAGSAGAEYFLSDRMSAGADVQLRGIAQGDPDREVSGDASGFTVAPSDPTLATRGLLMVRFYF